MIRRGGGRERERGFTLVEMLVALGILVFGLTSLIGLMSVGVSTRRTAELRDRAVQAADGIFHSLETGVFATRSWPGDDGEEPEPLEPIDVAKIEGSPRLKARVEFSHDDAFPDLVLVEVRIMWLEEGLTVGESFRRVMDHRVPFPARVAQSRSKP